MKNGVMKALLLIANIAGWLVVSIQAFKYGPEPIALISAMLLAVNIVDGIETVDGENSK